MSPTAVLGGQFGLTAPVESASTTPRTGWANSDPILTEYYDHEWGMPVWDERGVFERLSLEAFQSGLSWLTILKRRAAFRSAFSEFEPAAVAAFEQHDIARLLEDERIIRNRGKIEATISNARIVMSFAEAGTSLSQLVWSYMPERSPHVDREDELPSVSPESIALAKELKKHGFRYVGPTTVYSLMTAIGVVDGHITSSHRRGCSGLWNIDGTRLEVDQSAHGQR